MSDKLAECCNRLREEIHHVETSLTNTGHHLASAAEANVEELENGLKVSLEKCEAKRANASDAAHRLKQLVEDAKENVVSKYEDWKTDREIEKIEKDADKKEDRAVDAIVVAVAAILDAETAILDALRARKIAIDVAG